MSYPPTHYKFSKLNQDLILTMSLTMGLSISTTSLVKVRNIREDPEAVVGWTQNLYLLVLNKVE